jgi:hypothetical protein
MPMNGVFSEIWRSSLNIFFAFYLEQNKSDATTTSHKTGP